MNTAKVKDPVPPVTVNVTLPLNGDTHIEVGFVVPEKVIPEII